VGAPDHSSRQLRWVAATHVDIHPLNRVMTMLRSRHFGHPPTSDAGFRRVVALETVLLEQRAGAGADSAWLLLVRLTTETGTVGP